jgi:hypothetical protein
MRRLEEFIRSNRKKIDEFEPPEQLWEKIETQLNKSQRTPRVIKLKTFLSIAAILIVVSAAGFVFLKHSQKQSIDLTVINSDLARQQVHYISLIENKQMELSRIKREQPELYKEFSLVMDTVEQNYQQLKNSLLTSPNQEETLKAMVLNLRIQMEVLNQQLSIISQINQSQKGIENETQKL